MDPSVSNSYCSDNDEKDKCITYFWKSATNTIELSEFYVRTGVKAVAIGMEHCLLLGHNGKVFVQGSNKFGQLGLGDFVDRHELTENVSLSSIQVVNVECGSRHSGALTVDDKVFCWGDSGSGQCGVGEMLIVNEPKMLSFIDNNEQNLSVVITKLAFGELHSLGLTDKGNVWAWGSGAPLGFGDVQARSMTPKLIEDLSGKKVVCIACGSYHSLAMIDVQKSASVKTGNSLKKGKKFSMASQSPTYLRRDNIKRSNAESFSRKMKESALASTANSPSNGDVFTHVDSASLLNNGIHQNKVDGSIWSEHSTISGSIDAGISKVTNVMKKSVNEVLSYTSSLTNNFNDSTDGGTLSKVNISISPERQSDEITKELPEMKEPVSVEVWAWGRGTLGQLGHGTTEDRSYPCRIEELSHVGVIKVEAGNHHSLALTNYSQVYAWGDNSYSQLAIKKNVVNKPRKVKSLSNLLVWDIAAGSHFSLYIADSSESKTHVYVCGKKPSGLPMSCKNSSLTSRNNFIAPAESCSLREANGGDHLKGRKFGNNAKAISTVSVGDNICQITSFEKVGVLRRITAFGEQCVCLSVREPSQWLKMVYDIVRSERLFHYKLALIWQSTLEPLLMNVVQKLDNNEKYGQTLTQICKSFHHVMHHVAVTCNQLAQIVDDVMLPSDAMKVLHNEDYFNAFDNYSKVHSDCVACGVLDCFGKEASAIFIKSRLVFKEILEGYAEGEQNECDAFKEILQLPLNRVSQLAEILFDSHLAEPSLMNKDLFDLSIQWKELSTTNVERHKEAKLTWEFWQECPPKLADIYRRPHRRLLKSSKTCELYLPKSARFTSHWFVLLTDVFCHIVSNKTFLPYDLATLWASPVPDALGENFINAIKIVMPEDSLTLCSKTAIEKAQWLVVLNQTVAKTLSSTTLYRLSSETVNTKVGSFTPARARYATYFYVHDPKYKGACYTGMWLCGKPHGHGKLVWASTSQSYEGEFRNGLYHGSGRMIFVLNPSAGVAEEYNGEWKDGMMHGLGEMSYSDKKTYSGHWVQNVRHGHGVLRMGTLTSGSPSVFMGNWDNDKRSGYGMMDDIMRGEKYLGMWDNDMRNGNGLLVTLDGIYNEGRFSMNKLMGQGILLCHDDTKFEGDFCGDTHVNGKGKLTLPNGDRIEGTFQGQWCDGLKVNGMYFKGNGLDETSMDLFSEKESTPHSPFYIPAKTKWRSIFDECRHRLGCLGTQEPDVKKAWKCVTEDMVRPPFTCSLNEERQVIDDVLQGIDLDQAKKIAKDKKKLTEYLTKAFNLSCHPLGRLLETLVIVYRATYVGMGAHKRLLAQAVEEIKSYIERIYAIIRILFPSLPSEEFVHLSDSNEEVHQSDDDVVDSNTLLGPLLFPRFYPPLFTLYALRYEKNDSAYWERVLALNQHTDLTLMAYLEVKRTFWLAPKETNGIVEQVDQMARTNRVGSRYYTNAVEAFQQISTKFSPMEKISVLKETMQSINKEVQKFWKGQAKLESLDDLFPVFQFVVIRSRVHHLGSEIEFIEDLMESKYHSGEHGHMFTTLKACYYQIINER